MNRDLARMAMVVIAVGAAAGAVVASEPSKTPNVSSDPRSVGSVHPVLLVMFDGSPLTQKRAEEIAKAAGFPLIAFRGCRASDCAVFEVAGKGKKDRIFQFQVSSKRCLAEKDEQRADLPDLHADAARPAPSGSGRKQATAGAPTPAARRPDRARRGVAGEASDERGVSGCFGGYSILFRATQDNTFYADALNRSLTVRQTYQHVSGGSWKDLATLSASTWSLQSQTSSGKEQGYSVELISGDGTRLASSSLAWQAIASSASGDVTAQQLCAGQRDVIQAAENERIDELYAMCKMAPFPDTISGGLAAEMKDFGIGLTLGVSKSNDVCANWQAIAKDKTAVSVGAQYNDCLKNPGRYFPEHFTPVPGALTLDALSTAVRPQYYELENTEGCPASYTERDVTADMGGGTVCTAEAVRYSCHPEPGGKCECGNPQVEGAIVCTGA